MVNDMQILLITSYKPQQL